MFFRFVLLGIAFTFVLFIFDVLIPKIKSEYKRRKAIKERKQRQEAFGQKMKELEIK